MLRLLLALLVGLLVATGPAGADDAIRASGVKLERSIAGGEWLLSADFTITPAARLDEALRRGELLPLVIEFELREPRWWWLDRIVARASRRYQVSFHSLTRRYRLDTGEQIHQFEQLADLLDAIARVRGWPVVAEAMLEAGAHYEIRVRMRAVGDALPKPFRVVDLGQEAWKLESEWTRSALSIPIRKSAP